MAEHKTANRIKGGKFPHPERLTWNESMEALFSLVNVEEFGSLEFRTHRATSGQICLPPGRCILDQSSVRVRATLKELLNANLHEDCLSLRLGYMGSDPIHRLLSAAVAAELFLRDPVTMDPVAALDPLRAEPMARTIKMTLSVLNQLDLDEHMKEYADTLAHEVKVKQEELVRFAASETAREQILKICLLRTSTDKPSFEDILVTKSDRKDYLMGITGELVREEFFEDILGGYVKAFAVKASKRTGSVLLRLPQGVLRVLESTLNIAEGDVALFEPGDTDSVLETAIELFEPGNESPYKNITGALKAARVI